MNINQNINKLLFAFCGRKGEGEEMQNLIMLLIILILSPLATISIFITLALISGIIENFVCFILEVAEGVKQIIDKVIDKK